MGRLGVGAGLCLAIMAGACGESEGRVEGPGGGTSGAVSSGGTGAVSSGGTGSAQAGSGASVAGGGAAGSDSAGSGGRPDGGTGEFFVEARVDGEMVRGEADVRAYWYEGLTQGYLNVEAIAGAREWVIGAPNYDGANTCGAATITLMEYDGDQTTYHLSDPFVEVQHGCSLLVSNAAPNIGDVIEGTFSGKLTALPGGTTISVTDGAFRAVRIVDGLPR
jgi:hypothetical protein